MGAAMGGTVGGAIGAGAGASLGAAVVSLFVPGVGPIVAAGILGAALLGTSGALTGAKAGGLLEGELAKCLPHDVLFVYEHALRNGHSVVIVVADASETTERVHDVLTRAGAESIDAARESWWVGLRETEEQDYDGTHTNFKQDEATYRQGFEAALRPKMRARPYSDAVTQLDSELCVDRVLNSTEYICFVMARLRCLNASGQKRRPGRRIPILPFSNRLLRDRFANLLHCFSDFALRLSESLSNLAASAFRVAFILYFPITQRTTDFPFDQSLCLVQLPLYFVLVRQSHKISSLENSNRTQQPVADFRPNLPTFKRGLKPPLVAGPAS